MSPGAAPTYFVGIDIGSVGTKLAVIDDHARVAHRASHRTTAEPIGALLAALRDLPAAYLDAAALGGVGVTGSGKELAAVVLGADACVNEILTHGKGTATLHPEVRTIFEIGGQDSKVIILRDALVIDFGMNSVCAAGTGSFLEQQATRMGIALADLSREAAAAAEAVPIAARCTVFAESDMVYKQQGGFARDEILLGLCQALVSNYLNTVARGKRLEPPFCLQGGVAANAGMVRAFRERMGTEVLVPEHHLYMGALGAALFAREEKPNSGDTRFRAERLTQTPRAERFVCGECENRCNVITYSVEGTILGYRGDDCGRYSRGEGDPG